MTFQEYPDYKSIEDQVEKILGSRSLASKNQVRKLLIILAHNINSQTAIKPDGVIRELWPEEVQTKGSADVAKEMSRLRTALEAYYDGEGKNDPILISLPNRSKPGPDGTPERRWIVARNRDTKDQHAAPQTGGKRSLQIFATLAVLVVAACLSSRQLMRTRPPVSGRLDAGTLVILSADGQELWRKSFPDGFWRDYYEQGLATRMWFGDLQGNGATDILLLYHPAVNSSSRSTTLICYSDQGKEKWRWTPGRDLPELQTTPPIFVTVSMGILKGNGKGARIVVSSRHSLYYPDQIAIIDSTGKTASEYWHSGHLNYLAVADLKGNGRQQIIATGISNGYRQATMVVLDPDHVFGASTEAERPEVQLHGMGAAQERLRLLFPRSDLNQALSIYNESEEPVIAHGRIRLAIRECQQLPGCKIAYEFDSDFHLVSVEAYDQFRSVHKEFYLKSKANHPFTAEEEAQFRKVRCLAGCDSDLIVSLIH